MFGFKLTCFSSTCSLTCVQRIEVTLIDVIRAKLLNADWSIKSLFLILLREERKITRSRLVSGCLATAYL